jgi:hypothetical protein
MSTYISDWVNANSVLFCFCFDATTPQQQLGFIASTVGPESGLPLISDLVNFVLSDLLVPVMNKALASGFTLPAFGGLSFTQATLGLEQGYALVGIDFTLAATELLEAAAQVEFNA